jgi:hypothetical protein
MLHVDEDEGCPRILGDRPDVLDPPRQHVNDVLLPLPPDIGAEGFARVGMEAFERMLPITAAPFRKLGLRTARADDVKASHGFRASHASARGWAFR